ncbi:hypothetical protein ACJX0J_014344, partial [Zea mays]
QAPVKNNRVFFSNYLPHKTTEIDIHTINMLALINNITNEVVLDINMLGLELIHWKEQYGANNPKSEIEKDRRIHKRSIWELLQINTMIIIASRITINNRMWEKEDT